HDPWNGSRDMPAQTSHSAQRDFLSGCLSLSVLPGNHHVRFEQHGFETHIVLEKRVHRCLEDVTRHIFATTNAMGSVHHDLWFDNGYNVLLLAKQRTVLARGRWLECMLWWAALRQYE